MVQTKNTANVPLTDPFICEVPLGLVDETELSSIILNRLNEVIPDSKKDPLLII